MRHVVAERISRPAAAQFPARARVQRLPHGKLGGPHVLQQEAARVVPPRRPVNEQRGKPQAVVERQGCLVVFFYLQNAERRREDIRRFAKETVTRACM